MSLKEISQKKKKIKRVFSKRAKTGYEAGPMDSFWAFKDYARSEADKKDTAQIIKEYIKETFKKPDAAMMLKAPEYNFVYPYYIAATIKWQKLGFEIPANWNYVPMFDRYFASLKIKGTKKEAAEGEPPAPQKSIQDILKEKTSDFIAVTEAVLDDFYNGVFQDIDSYSPYMELKKIDAPYSLAKGVYDYYLPLKEEIQTLIDNPTKDLAEGYNHLSKAKKNDYLKLLTVILTDAEKYMFSKKAVRKVKVSKPISAERQTKGLHFNPESIEFKLKSINPVLVVGAMRLYTFNAKNRMFGEYVSHSPTGFGIKGSSLTGVDADLSREVRLRKPEEFLSMMMKLTPTKIDTEWKKLTTKTGKPNSRINKDMLLLKVFDK